MNPKISIIVPVYNTEQYLRECLDSVLSQTLQEIEVICINDGSPDNSIGILREYEAKDYRVTVIDKKNEGVAKARNDGMALAKGEFIAFMDSDDYYPSGEVLEKLYNNAVSNCVKASGGSCLVLKHGEVTQQESVEFGYDFSATGKLTYSEYQYDYGYTRFIFNRKAVTENNVTFPPLGRFQDPPFMVRAMDSCKDIYIDSFPSYVYRLTPAGYKISPAKTLDFLSGLILNLDFSRDKGYHLLHYLTYKRLETEGTYMVTSNLCNDKASELLSMVTQVIKHIDADWLRENGYDITDPIKLDLFDHMLEVYKKYDKIRNCGVSKLVRKVTGICTCLRGRSGESVKK